VENEIVHDATNVVVGAHCLDTEAAATLPQNTIIYNSERVFSSSTYLPTLQAFVSRFETWDYSAGNVRAWRELGISDRVRWLKPGYVPECTTIDPATPTDIDALFYGHVNRRRRAILDELAKAGIRTYVLMNTFGGERDAYIARAKLVLNLHDAPDAVFEMARAVHVLSHRRLLVSESTDDESIADLVDGMVIGDASELAGLCRKWLDDDERRMKLAERGFELFSRRDFPATLRDVLDQREHGD
jgi:glycosyltransferase involved in cell wall biosynthesis